MDDSVVKPAHSTVKMAATIFRNASDAAAASASVSISAPTSASAGVADMLCSYVGRDKDAYDVVHSKASTLHAVLAPSVGGYASTEEEDWSTAFAAGDYMADADLDAALHDGAEEGYGGTFCLPSEEPCMD